MMPYQFGPVRPAPPNLHINRPPPAPQVPTPPQTPAVPGRVEQAYRRLFGPIYGDLLPKVIDWKNIGKVVQIADRELGVSFANKLVSEIESKKKLLRNTGALLDAQHEMWRAVCNQIAEMRNEGIERMAEVNLETLISERDRAYEEKDRLEQKAFQLDSEIKNLEKTLRDMPFYPFIIIPRNIARHIAHEVAHFIGNIQLQRRMGFLALS